MLQDFTERLQVSSGSQNQLLGADTDAFKYGIEIQTVYNISEISHLGNCYSTLLPCN